MTAKPRTGQTVEIEGIIGTFTIKSVNRSKTRITLVNSRGGTGTAALRSDGFFYTERAAAVFVRRVLLPQG